jgi:hypothetical protein
MSMWFTPVSFTGVFCFALLAMTMDNLLLRLLPHCLTLL